MAAEAGQYLMDLLAGTGTGLQDTWEDAVVSHGSISFHGHERAREQPRARVRLIGQSASKGAFQRPAP